jgi:hypothetical protein
MPFATPTWAMAVGAEMPFAKRTHKDSSTGMSQFSVMRMQQYRAGWLFCLFGLNPISPIDHIWGMRFSGFFLR